MFSTTDTIIVDSNKILPISRKITSSVILKPNATIVFTNNGSMKTDDGGFIPLTGQSMTNKLETPAQLSIINGALGLTTLKTPPVELGGGAEDFTAGDM